LARNPVKNTSKKCRGNAEEERQGRASYIWGVEELADSIGLLVVNAARWGTVGLRGADREKTTRGGGKEKGKTSGKRRQMPTACKRRGRKTILGHSFLRKGPGEL